MRPRVSVAQRKGTFIDLYMHVCANEVCPVNCSGMRPEVKLVAGVGCCVLHVLLPTATAGVCKYVYVHICGGRESTRAKNLTNEKRFDLYANVFEYVWASE